MTGIGIGIRIGIGIGIGKGACAGCRGKYHIPADVVSLCGYPLALRHLMFISICNLY